MTKCSGGLREGDEDHALFKRGSHQWAPCQKRNFNLIEIQTFAYKMLLKSSIAHLVLIGLNSTKCEV